MSTKQLPKESIWKACESLILSRIATAQEALALAQSSSQEDTKSSAGDKFETGREMLQQEMTRHRQLLAEANLMYQNLLNISPSAQHTSIQTGSVAETNRGLLFFGIGIGALTVEDKQVFAISMASPLGRLFYGQKAGNVITFNQTKYQIIQVY